MKTLTSVSLLGAFAAGLHAQTIQDGIMMGRHNLFTGIVYSIDRWDRYWQGSLNRANGNLGRVTTQTNTWSGNFGVTDRLNVIALVPYIWTEANQGVLAGLSGFQDLTVAVKYAAIDRPFTSKGSIRVIGVVSGSKPLSDYNPDFLPLSIGNQSERLSARLTVNFQSKRGWYINGSAAHTWRGEVTLDRPYYYTENKLFLTDKVDMPGVFDHIGSVGYLRRGVNAFFSFSQQRTQGGGDIRRQDAPFISNKFNYSKIGTSVMVPLPKLRGIALQFAFDHTLDGRNVGESNTYTAALMYTLPLHRRTGR